MKRYFLATFTLLFLACNNDYEPRTFDSVTIKSSSIDSVSIRAIHVVNDSTLYYAGSNATIGYTNTNGKTWELHKFIYQDTIKPHFRSIAFNEFTNFVYVLSVGNPALLYQYNFSDTFLVYKEKHKKVFYDSMQFFDENNGIAMGDPTEDCLSIIVTKDGGNSWTKIPCDKLPKVTKGEAAFAASNTNIKVLGKTAWIVTGGIKARVFKTNDLGETWKVFNTPIIQGNGPQGIYSVDFADENNGIVIGGDYSKPNENKANVAITKDGGKTWQLVANGVYPNYKSCVQIQKN